MLHFLLYFCCCLSACALNYYDIGAAKNKNRKKVEYSKSQKGFEKVKFSLVLIEIFKVMFFLAVDQKSSHIKAQSRRVSPVSQPRGKQKFCFLTNKITKKKTAFAVAADCSKSRPKKAQLYPLYFIYGKKFVKYRIKRIRSNPVAPN